MRFSHLGIVGDCCAIHGRSECNAEVGARIIVFTLVEDRDILHPAPQEPGIWKAPSQWLLQEPKFEAATVYPT